VRNPVSAGSAPVLLSLVIEKKGKEPIKRQNRGEKVKAKSGGVARARKLAHDRQSVRALPLRLFLKSSVSIIRLTAKGEKHRKEKTWKCFTPRDS